jgi:hypothetical protein
MLHACAKTNAANNTPPPPPKPSIHSQSLQHVAIPKRPYTTAALPSIRLFAACSITGRFAGTPACRVLPLSLLLQQRSPTTFQNIQRHTSQGRQNMHRTCTTAVKSLARCKYLSCDATEPVAKPQHRNASWLLTKMRCCMFRLSRLNNAMQTDYNVESTVITSCVGELLQKQHAGMQETERRMHRTWPSPYST